MFKKILIIIIFIINIDFKYWLGYAIMETCIWLGGGNEKDWKCEEWMLCLRWDCMCHQQGMDWMMATFCLWDHGILHLVCSTMKSAVVIQSISGVASSLALAAGIVNGYDGRGGGMQWWIVSSVACWLCFLPTVLFPSLLLIWRCPWHLLVRPYDRQVVLLDVLCLDYIRIIIIGSWMYQYWF